MESPSVFLQAGIIFAILTGVTGEDYCHFLLTCQDGYVCCDGNSRCCLDTGWVNTSAIVGIVTGGVIFVVVVVGLVIALACGCTKQRGRRGNIVNPTAPVQIISTGSMLYPNYGQPYYQDPPPTYSRIAGQPGNSQIQRSMDNQPSMNYQQPMIYQPPINNQPSMINQQSRTSHENNGDSDGAFRDLPTPTDQIPPNSHKVL